MKNTDYLDLSKGLNGFEGLVPSFGKNMGEKYMTGRRKGATDYLEVIDCEAVKDYIEKKVETPKYDGRTVSFDGFVSEKASNDTPQPVQTVVPTIPIIYIFVLALNAISDTPYSSVLLQSRAFRRLLSDGIAIYPNVLLNFVIRDVYNFFDSIDESGVAHINNLYNNPIYTEDALLNPQIYNWLVDFLQWHNLKIEDMKNLKVGRDMIESSVAEMKLAFNADLQSYDEVGNLIFDFNYSNMHFYDDIGDCLIDFSKYSDEIEYMYNSIGNELPVRAIFILLNTKEGALFPKLTIGFISDEYTIFTMLQNKENKIS